VAGRGGSGGRRGVCAVRGLPLVAVAEVLRCLFRRGVGSVMEPDPTSGPVAAECEPAFAAEPAPELLLLSVSDSVPSLSFEASRSGRENTRIDTGFGAAEEAGGAEPGAEDVEEEEEAAEAGGGVGRAAAAEAATCAATCHGAARREPPGDRKGTGAAAPVSACSGRVRGVGELVLERAVGPAVGGW
jgi:hypothetical protein